MKKKIALYETLGTGMKLGGHVLSSSPFSWNSEYKDSPSESTTTTG
jgi:hypothetical protein